MRHTHISESDSRHVGARFSESGLRGFLKAVAQAVRVAVSAQKAPWSVVHDERVRFIQADIFSWQPEQRYDVVFFGFWLSHVPPQRFDSFWSLVADCLKPDGRVLFVDDAYRTPDELVYGKSSPIVRRRSGDGTAYRVVRVPHQTNELEERLRRLGWSITVTQTVEPFFWGAGSLT